ncbi:YPDG domain-containing protein, partial [Corynebacterium afermentans]|nr:YPDG domain-containing protein [Corynebacterium afermentans]
MKKNYIARRRGTSVAAAALSFALAASFAQPVAAPQFASAAFAGTKDEAGQPNDLGTGVKYPGENADGVYQTGVGEPRYVVGDQPIKVEGAIESDVEAGSNNSIEGYVINQRNGNMSVHPGTNNLKPIPMEGVRIYAQWVERDGATSPIYTTTTGADGRFTIGMKSFVDSLGKVRKFDADPNLPEGEKFRIWAENPDPDAFTQLYGSGQGKLFPLGNTMELSAGMRNLVGSDRLENVRFAFGEKVQNDVMHNLQASEENAPWKQPSVNAYGQVTGTVHWDLTRAATVAGWGDWVAYNKADVPAKGLKVYGSYLSDYAVGQILNEAPKDLGGKKIRGSGWSRDDEAALQNWIKRKIAEEGKDKWIAETTETTVGEDGDYVLQFKGTFGKAWDNRGYDDGSLIYTDLARDNDAEAIFPDGSKHKAYDLFNTVAPAADYGSWMSNASGRGGENLPKHINWDWLFVSTEDVDGAAVVTPFHTNAYTDKTNVNTDQTWAGVWNTVQAGRLANNNIALYSDYTVFDVLKYDTQQNYAKPGDDPAETFTSGLPSKFVDGLKYEIEWVNTTTGEVVHKCEAQAAKGDTTIKSCPLDFGDKNLFPDGITQTTTFAANLYPVNAKTGERGSRIATDAFTVLIDWAPEYEPTEAKPGETKSSGAPTFDRTDTDEVEKLTAEQLAKQDPDKKPTKFELPEGFTVPEGYDVNVDEATGVVTVTFPAEDAKSIDVPVKVTYEDGTTATGKAPFTVAVDAADEFEPGYEDGSGKPGEDVKVPAPEFKDKDGNPTEAPEGTEFTPGENAPDGVKVDENTGEITVPVPEDANPGDKITVPVEVTYPDGSKDNVDVTVTVENPDAKTADEIEPGYEDGSGKPGEDVKVPAPEFKDKDGNPTEAPEGTEFTP